jgi:NAD(P)H-hydrate epimerase
MGVYIHGRAGDIAVVDKGTEGLIASDLVEYLPQVFT